MVRNVLHSNIEAYGAVNKDESVLRSSSSGGVVQELCKYIANNNGVVFAAQYDYIMHTLKHSMITDLENIERLKGSKYFQSDLSSIYYDMEQIIKENPNRKLLFIGTPCQCAAIRKYFDSKKLSTDNVILVDIICHGVGSNKIWKDYICSIEKKANTKISDISFKDKRRGWLLPYAVSKGYNGEEYVLNDYMTLYNKHLIMRDECHSCIFATKKRVGDISVGDFWNVREVEPSFYNEYGVSCVLINTMKGKDFFAQVREKFHTISVSIDDCNQPNLQAPTKRNPHTDNFWSDYQKKGFEYVRRKYASTSKIDRIKRYIFVRLGLWKV